MSKFIGRLVDVGIGRETSRGTGVAATFWIPKAEFTLDLKVMKARSNLAYGTIAGEGSQAPVALRFAEGDIMGAVTDKTFGLFLYNLFGTLVTSGPTDSLYTHTFSVEEGVQHDSMTINVEEHDLGDIRFRNAMLNSLKMEFVPEDLVKYTASWVAKAPQDSSETPSYTVENKFLGRMLSFKMATLTSGLAAATATNIKKLTLTFEKNVIQDWVLGTAEPEDILNRSMRITGEIEYDYQSRATFRDLMKDGSYRALRIAMTNTDVTIGAASNPSFTLDLSKVDFDEWEPNRPNDDLATEKIVFHALYDGTNGNVVNSCTLKNAQSSY